MPTAADATAATAAETAETTDTSTEAITSETATVEEKDWKNEAEKWKALARKHEDAVKGLRPAAARLAELEDAQKTELQREADRAAKAEKTTADTVAKLARLEAAVKYGLDSEDVAALEGIPSDRVDAIASRLATKAAKAAETKPKPDFGGGDRGGDVTDGPEFDAQIDAAMKAGNFQLAIALKEQRHAASLKKP